MPQIINATDANDAVRLINAKFLQEKLKKHIVTTGLIGAGVGLTSRGLGGLLDLISRTGKKTFKNPNLVPVEIPVPASRLPKSWPTSEEEENEKISAETSRSFIQGDFAKDITSIPYALPALTAATVGSSVGGWKLMDWILDRRRKAELNEKLEQAKREYEEALLAEYSTGKKASTNTLGDLLEQLYTVTKQAGVSDIVNYEIPALAGTTVGAYGTLAGITSIATALKVYSEMKKRQRAKLLEQASARRQQQRSVSLPPSLYVQPVLSEG